MSNAVFTRGDRRHDRWRDRRGDRSLRRLRACKHLAGGGITRPITESGVYDYFVESLTIARTCVQQKRKVGACL